MKKAYVETTILADSLLKGRQRRLQIAASLQNYSETLLPVYAIKEFKAGVLTYFAWFHNKLITTDSLSDAFFALQVHSRTPQRNRNATAWQALAVAEESIATAVTPEVALEHPSTSGEQNSRRAELTLVLASLIRRAWRNRRKNWTKVVDPLSCYVEPENLKTEKSLIKTMPTACDVDNCCMVTELAARTTEVSTIKDIVDKGQREEDKRRSRSLRHILRTPNRSFGNDMCRNLGDAVFALFAPGDATIVTSNVKDIEPLATAIGKSVDRV